MPNHLEHDMAAVFFKEGEAGALIICAQLAPKDGMTEEQASYLQRALDKLHAAVVCDTYA